MHEMRYMVQSIEKEEGDVNLKAVLIQPDFPSRTQI